MNDLEELLTESIMTNTPLILVEGKDDVKFYESLCASIPEKEYQVLPIELVDNYSEGCESVIKALSDIQHRIIERPENNHYIIGMIDRDSREFRGDLPNGILGLFVLKYYSYEAHFVTKNNLRKLVSHITNINEKNIDTQTIVYLEANLPQRYDELFLISLESLMNACFEDYSGIIGYSADPGRLTNSHSRKLLMDQLENKRQDLLQFAKDYDITINDLRLVSKGKWLLYTYCDVILDSLRDASNNCSTRDIYKCPYCSSDQIEKCLWKLNLKCGVGDAVQYLMNFIDEQEVGYIIDALASLGPQPDLISTSLENAS